MVHEVRRIYCTKVGQYTAKDSLFKETVRSVELHKRE